MELALSIKYMLCIKFWYTFDRSRVAACIEVDDLLVGVFEWKNDRICRKCCELGMKFLTA